MSGRIGQTRGRSAVIDMTGRVCGSWIVLRRAPHVKGQNGVRWVALHSCGAEHVVEGFRLRRAPTETCKTCAPNLGFRGAPEWLREMSLSQRCRSVILGTFPSTARANRGYRATPITSREELEACSEIDLLKRPGCGRKTLRLILEALGRE